MTVDTASGQKDSGFLSLLGVASDSRVGIFSFFFYFTLKRCPVAAKIAGSIGILPCCALNEFFI